MSSGTSQELARFKNLVGSWEKVARRHPYSVFNGERSAEYDEARKEDPFTTHFGEGLPVRVYDRNEMAREANAAAATMEQPYPSGYTGYVPKIRHVVGQTYGRSVREAINQVTPETELASTEGVPLASTQQLAHPSPADQLADRQQRAAAARSTRCVDATSGFASTSALAFAPPPPEAYATPAWSTAVTANIGQPDTYKHGNKSILHPPKLPESFTTKSSLNSVTDPA